MAGHAVSPVPRDARPYQGRPAGVVSRMSAAVLDGLIVAASVFVGYGTVAIVRFMWDPLKFTFPTVPWLLTMAIALVVTVVYLTAGWAATGRTYGKAVMGLRVVGPRGQKLRVPGALVRALACTLFPIGLLWCAISPRNRSVQDALLRTSVVYDWT